jgi:hypothetical protein
MFFVLAPVLVLSGTYVPTAKGANEKLHFCHNGHLICTNEDNEIRAHEVHVTNGKNCTFDGPCSRQPGN